MKNNLYKTLLMLIGITGYTSILAQTVQTLPEVDGKVIYQNLRLEKEGSNLVLSFDIRVLDKALNNRQSWKVMPELIPGNAQESVFFPTLLINGRQKERHYNRRMNYKNKELLASQPLIRTYVPQDQEQLISYRTEISYESWMENSSLTFHQILTSPREKKQLFTTVGLIKLIPDPPAEPDPPVIVTQPPVQKTLTIKGEARIQFPVGQTDIRPTYMNNMAELEKIEKDIRKILQDESLTLECIHLTGYASPEARYITNARLSEGRTHSLKTYLQNKYNLPPRKHPGQ